MSAIQADSPENQQPPRGDQAPIPCTHCGAPVPMGVSYASSLSTPQPTHFCCSGCRAVFEFLHASKLERYYKIRAADEHAQSFPAQLPQQGFQHFDDPQVQARYTTSPSPTTCSVTFFLPGIHCAACVWLLERLPHIVPGVHDARVNLTLATLTVSYNPQITQLSHLGRTIASLGYRPELHNPNEHGGQRQNHAIGRELLFQLGIAAFAAMNTMLFAVSLYQAEWTGIPENFRKLLSWVSMVVALPAVVYAALPFYRTALGGLRVGRIHIDLPVSLGIIAGFILSVVNTFRGSLEIYYDSVTALIFLLLIGRVVHQRTLAKVLKTSDLLNTIAPSAATRLAGDETTRTVVATTALHPGDKISVAPQALIPVDGLVSSPAGKIDVAALTGESEPHNVTTGDRVYAGTKNIGTELILAVEAVGEDTRFGRILTAVTAAKQTRAPIELFTDKVGRIFTVVVLGVSLLTFLGWLSAGPFTAAYNALALLVVTCPCALAITTPLVLSLALHRAAHRGIFIKGGEVLERLNELRQIAFDKTGTLTEGKVAVLECVTVDSISPHQVAPVLAALEHGIEHPVAQALRHWSSTMSQDAAHSFTSPVVSRRQLLPGRGLGCTIIDVPTNSPTDYLVGRLDLFSEIPAAFQSISGAWEIRGISTVGFGVEVQGKGVLQAMFGVRDTIRPGAPELIQSLIKQGFSLSILSGDNQTVVDQIAQELGFPVGSAQGNLSPEGKVAAIERLLTRGPVAMIGDGMNDAAALRAATVGIGVHGGAEACMRVADIYLTRAHPEIILDVFSGAKRTVQLIRRNLGFSLGYNLIGGAAAISGILHPLMAAILMPLSSLTVITASFRGRTFDSVKQ